MSNGPAIVPVIVIEGTREDWPGGHQILTPLAPAPRPEPDTFRFGAQVEPSGILVWFRITNDDIRGMPENTPRARGERLVDALIVRLKENPDYRLEVVNHFQVFVTEAGDVTVEPEPDDE